MNNTEKIQLAATNQCTGCAACASICPTNSITMREDKEGFLQPHIDMDTCIRCHKCEKSCPIIKPIDIPTDFETQAYAAINKDEAVRMRSTSGGVFYALARWTIEQGGVVFGARFNENWEVVHDYTEAIEGIESFMRSKYVQSRIGDTYKQTKDFLKAGRQVLYVGTPCQIAGLQMFLGKDYESLIMVDFICHGIPSPGVWREYLKEVCENDKILDVHFRDKRNGWLPIANRNITIRTNTNIVFENRMENAFLRTFHGDMSLRRACYACAFKQYHRSADITLADFWGIDNIRPNFCDDKGTSLVLIHSKKGERYVKCFEKEYVIYEKIEDGKYITETYNISSVVSEKLTYKRHLFFFLYKLIGLTRAVEFIEGNSFAIRGIRKTMRIWNSYLCVLTALLYFAERGC